MLDIKFVRENPDALDEAMANRQGSSGSARSFFEFDGERRAVITEVEELQAQRNAESKKIGMLMKEGKREEADAAKEAVRLVDRREDRGPLGRRAELEAEQADFMARIPNIPGEATPVGKNEDEIPSAVAWASPAISPPRASSPRLTGTWASRPASLDFDRGAKLSGARFTVLSGARATLDRALQNFLPQHAHLPRLHRVYPAGHRQPRDHVRHRSAAQVRG